MRNLADIGAPQLHHTLEHSDTRRLTKCLEESAIERLDGSVNCAGSVKDSISHATDYMCMLMHASTLCNETVPKHCTFWKAYSLGSEMSVPGRTGEVGQMPNITVRPPSAIDNFLDLY
ncbi:hypothetical protein EMIT043CA1_230033 [Pseudomonas brassicacearum]|nr:hypothetical protein GCM10020185_63400 [Pseudomonas brassicacearum subsp. brassicacearum]